jgi:hypothetical protein
VCSAVAAAPACAAAHAERVVDLARERDAVAAEAAAPVAVAHTADVRLACAVRPAVQSKAYTLGTRQGRMDKRYKANTRAEPRRTRVRPLPDRCVCVCVCGGGGG